MNLLQIYSNIKSVLFVDIYQFNRFIFSNSCYTGFGNTVVRDSYSLETDQDKNSCLFILEYSLVIVWDLDFLFQYSNTDLYIYNRIYISNLYLWNSGSRRRTVCTPIVVAILYRIVQIRDSILIQKLFSLNIFRTAVGNSGF